MDDLFTVLENRDRRYALYFLLEHGTVSIDELADVVTGWTRAAAYGMASRRVRDRVFLDLKHRHVPALAEAGLARDDDGSVTLEPIPVPTQAFVRKICTAETGVERG